ncbi:hypothetical protein ACFSKU_13015 [Pontibacter silvestris]|uniref:Uncharacterized protein n=1 Tax=Pontibacter silvestris TaxID=2305183 RepID=A0ABW4WYN7_9BACT|nr:hypothetical protein [Pontibacter silvestris]MCC9135633.1 hypothetical protein [Pontibacter silvestris]
MLKKQSADQQWLGVSISSLCFWNTSLRNYLLDLCKKRGIGLIAVGKRTKVVLMQEPGKFTWRKRDFISHYNSEEQIRLSLSNSTCLRVA